MSENIQNENNIEPAQNSTKFQENTKDNNLNSNQKKENTDSQLIESIKQFFGGPCVDENNVMHDISYTTWVEKDVNIKKLCTPYEVVIPSENKENQNNPFGDLTRHDYRCELKFNKMDNRR